MTYETKPWIHKMWSVSPFNFAKEALASLPERVEILDTTLRDGISDPVRTIFLTTSHKIRIAQMLDGLGIRCLEVGLTTEDAITELRAITKVGLKAKTLAMTPTASFSWNEWEAVDIALNAHLSGVVCNFPASEYLVRKSFPGWTTDKMLEKSISMAAYAKERGLFVNFFPYDTTRAEPAFLEKLLKVAVEEAKVDTVSIVDTLGVGSPAGIAHMVRLIKSWVDVPIELHMHDDFGLAYANALAGIGAGAHGVHTTINGIGKMPATEDIVISLLILYGLDSNIMYDKLFEVCSSIRKIGGWSIDPLRPISGDLAFAYDSDHKIDQNRSQRAPFVPEFIGHKYRIILSERTGPEALKWRLKEIKKEANDEQIDRILMKIKNRLKKTGRHISDEEFGAIVREVIG